MSTVYIDDEWKYCGDDSKPPTRAEEQARIDREYALGRMSREEWSKRFDELGNPEIWISEGKVKK